MVKGVRPSQPSQPPRQSAVGKAKIAPALKNSINTIAAFVNEHKYLLGAGKHSAGPPTPDAKRVEKAVRGRR
jgi:hypothetical protein